jgi:branched-chain amino acid aminotransferase
MQSSTMIDGVLVPPERAVVSVFDRGFLYGDSVFETLRTHGGRLSLLDEHLARLERSAARVFISLPVPLSTLREEVLNAVRAHGSAESYVRLMLTRGTARALGLAPELAEQPRRVVLVTALALPPPEVYERGIEAITFRIQRPSDELSVANAKIGNYLATVLALRKARESGASEALLENAAGEILEGSTSNVFAVIGGRLVTPPETAAILAGITRARVIDAARAAEIPLELRALARAELQHAEEVFITSSIREVVPVVKLDGQGVGPGTPGPIARELLRRFREAALDPLAKNR